MGNLPITRWIDVDSADFKRLEYSNRIRKIIDIGLEAGITTIDRAGYIWQDGAPIYAELDGCRVGIRYAAKAAN